jgi:hypothetical protein
MPGRTLGSAQEAQHPDKSLNVLDGRSAYWHPQEGPAGADLAKQVHFSVLGHWIGQRTNRRTLSNRLRQSHLGEWINSR